MENFEYSIQLNDRDWAEFYLASEECSLIQAALATAEELLPSDLDNREVENRLIRVRVVPTPSPAGCLPRGAPREHLQAEEVLSGSEDETDLGSVGRFLCDNSPYHAVFPQSSAVRGSKSSCVVSEPLGELPEERGASFAAEGREPETEDRFIDSNRPLPEVDVAVQKAGFQGRISGLEAMEKPMNAGASKGMEEHGSRPLGLALQQPTNDISQTASADLQFPLLVGSSAVCGNPESPESKDPNVHPTSSSSPSGESEGAEHLEMGTKHPQVNWKAEAPPFQEQPSLFQGHSVPPLGTWPPSDPRSESHKKGVLKSRSNEEENAADLKAKGQMDQNKDLVDSIFKKEGQVDQETSSASCKVDLQKAPEEPEANKCSRPTIVTNSRCSGTLDQHREAAVLKAETQKDGVEEPYQRLGPAPPLEGEPPNMAQGSQRSNLLEDNIPYCLALENSPEGHLAVMTWPQDYDHSTWGNAQEQAEKMQDGVAEKRLASDVGQDVPEMYGPDMYEYFFTDMEEACVGDSGREKEMGLETPSSSDQPLAPSTGSQDSDSIAADEAALISVPEVYEHFFNNGAQGRKSWKQLFLSMPASEARKAVRALKSLLSKPAHFLRRHPPSPGTPPRRGSHGKLVVFSPRLLEESQPRSEDLRMAVMSPVLLANFGTLSAIRYFRRQITAEGEHGT